MDKREALPVNECLDDLVAALRQSTPVVLKAPPGAGKTTGVPPALLDAKIAGSEQILLVQPRRMAARAAAHRLAMLRGCRLGTEVGYHVRFDKCSGRETKLLAVTTGLLLRRLASDPLLDGVGCVLLDEFHERSVEMDLVLGMLQRIRTTLRPELKLVVMSATLDPGPLLSFLGDAKSLESQGRSYPVTIEYTDHLSQSPPEQQVAEALERLLPRTSGHVLVFLPGVGEIRRTRRRLEQAGFDRESHLFDLYGDLPPDKQDAVLRASDQRKIILATNVAETSITIPGVSAVVDTGTARVLQHDPRVGLPKLQLEPISQASADQRAGRAGRTEAGICYRLWPPALQRSRRVSDQPEISRCDFSGPLLTLAGWGEREVFAFPWLTAPPRDAVETANKLLQLLDAIAPDGTITELGREMLGLPLTPRLARFMLEAARWNVEEDAALVAAMLSERDPFRGDSIPTAASSHECDLWDRLERLHAFSNGERGTVGNPHAAKQITRVAEQILRELGPRKATDSAGSAQQAHMREQVLSEEPSVRLKRALLAAFPDRVARRRTAPVDRDAGADRGIMVGGRGVRLDRQSSVQSSELFLCIDVDSKGSEALVRSASGIDPAWLDPHHVREVEEPFFDSSLASVVARRRRYFHDLLLSESPIPCRPSPEVARLLATEARQPLSRALPKDDKALQSFIHQVRFLHQHMPELGIPNLDQAALEEVLDTLCQTRTSLAELRTAPWLDHLRGRYDYDQLKQIEKHAPARITVPSGNSVAITYAEGKPPRMEVRIQEIFGWRETPRIAGGRVPIQMHLLGPNYRPQQITEDLQSFWRETYDHIRKELRRRYPKHHWPEDPLNAASTRNGLKPRS